MTDNQRFELAERLAILHDGKAELQAQLKSINAEFDELEAELAIDMVTTESGSFNYKGRNFVLCRKEHISENKEAQEELYEELRKRGHGELFTVNAQRFQRRVKEWTEANEGEIPEWLDGLLNIYTKNEIQIRKGRNV
jgi:histidinol-phosphate/aromatic aminotransferase/cobyric acid decarboxylase-like protein